ncbi:hypothetical protein QR680_002909 [Steinernema hermaphroditum]|uniref:Uncharacterized protein n=1 Tax=Steinernema hermaphroditum TaxID=289476 RepID=A0AA39H4L6_9BILA|nr:hypothetical protein QR680_002909 [Steinernema hermaphroditum]
MLGDRLSPALLAFGVALTLFFRSSSASDEEQRLYGDLLSNYNPLERPVNESNSPLVVKVRLFLQQIVDVDEKNQVVQVNAWMRYIWTDYKLTWNPRDYSGIRDVRFPGNMDHIWRPDVLLYNSADENFDTTYKSNLLVYYNGEVNWIPPGILKFSCKMDITWFPFDDQLCDLKFGSWTYHGLALDLQIDSDNPNSTDQMDLSDYVVNGEWTLIATPAVREVTFYKCCPEPYPTVVFRMHIRRRTLYYGFNLIIPSLLISLMTVLGFTLPPDAGEKITLEITILLSVCFFLSMVAEMTPPTSEAVPLIGVFFSCCMLVVSASVVFTVVVLNLHFRNPDTHVMTPFVRRVLLEWLPWAMMMSRPGHRFAHGRYVKAESHRTKMKAASESIVRRIDSEDPSLEAEVILLHRIYLEMKEIIQRMEEEDEKEMVENDWRFAALVVDRVCLIVFSIFISLSTCALMLSAPHINA